MRIAILLPGMPRTFRRCLSAFRRQFARYQTDCFASIWNVSGEVTKSKKYNADPSVRYYNTTPSSYSDLLSAYQFVASRVEPWQGWIQSQLPHLSRFQRRHPAAARQMLANGIWSQYYHIFKSFQLIPEPEQYDLIVKWRFDITCRNIPFESLDRSRLWVAPHKRFTPSDAYFFGPPHLMSSVCHLFHWLPSMPPFSPSALFPGFDCYLPEMILSAFLDRHHIPFSPAPETPSIVR